MFDGVTVRFLAPTVALMHGDGSVMMPWQATIAPSRRSRQTYVVVKESDTWRIAAFQNVRMRPLTEQGKDHVRVLRTKLADVLKNPHDDLRGSV